MRCSRQPQRLAMQRFRQRLSPKKKEGQRKRWPKVAVEGLEPGRENTGNAPPLVASGSPGGTVNPNSAFNTALIEAGFSRAEVTRMLSALNEAGLAVVAMASGAWGD